MTTSSLGFVSRDALEASLQQQFAAGSVWPIDHAALAALLDMGLSERDIARYFHVAPQDVSILCSRFCLRQSVR